MSHTDISSIYWLPNTLVKVFFKESECVFQGALEQKAGQLVQRYGETYIAERGLPADAPLRSNQDGFGFQRLIHDCLQIRSNSCASKLFLTGPAWFSEAMGWCFLRFN